MKITIVRRISQIFFFALFLWFCIVSSFGQEFWELRGWPVNWFLQLDPLVALGNLLTTRSLYAGLVWALATVAITAVLGRFFCGWMCPFGSIHHFVGYIGARGRSAKERIASNRYRDAQKIKYYILIVLLSSAAGAPHGEPCQFVGVERRHHYRGTFGRRPGHRNLEDGHSPKSGLRSRPSLRW